jgi:hypothetical protein
MNDYIARKLINKGDYETKEVSLLIPPHADDQVNRQSNENEQQI